MKKVLLIVLLLVVGIPGYNFIQNNPSEIRNPIYVESRVVWQIPEISRDLEYVLVGEMASEEDCERRSERYLKKLFKKCEACQIKTMKCRTNLDKRYKRLFLGYKTHTTYLSFNRGNRFERNGRMVIWGLTNREAEVACKKIKEKIEDTYTGTVQCVVSG